MRTDREHLDTDAKGAERDRPTEERSEFNRYEVHCAECGGRWYVDELTGTRFQEALAYDPADEPFICPECEEAYGDEEHQG
jgi:hypothetical protein